MYGTTHHRTPFDWSGGTRPCSVQKDPPPAAAASQGCLKARWARRSAHAPASSRAAWAANEYKDGERCSGQLEQPDGVHPGVRLLRGGPGERVAVPVPVPDARRRWVKWLRTGSSSSIWIRRKSPKFPKNFFLGRLVVVQLPFLSSVRFRTYAEWKSRFRVCE